jgi:hypothetical protein
MKNKINIYDIFINDSSNGGNNENDGKDGNEISKELNSQDDAKMEEYNEQYRFWTDKALSQMTHANYVFISLAIALLVYGIKESGIGHMSTESCIFRCFLVSIGLSILCGTTVLLTRLYDFRYTRKIVRLRQKKYKSKKDNDDEIEKLRSKTDCLGEWTWRFLLVQSIFFGVGIISYILSWLL